MRDLNESERRFVQLLKSAFPQGYYMDVGPDDRHHLRRRERRRRRDHILTDADMLQYCSDLSLFRPEDIINVLPGVIDFAVRSPDERRKNVTSDLVGFLNVPALGHEETFVRFAIDQQKVVAKFLEMAGDWQGTLSGPLQQAWEYWANVSQRHRGTTP